MSKIKSASHKGKLLNVACVKYENQMYLNKVMVKVWKNVSYIVFNDGRYITEHFIIHPTWK